MGEERRFYRSDEERIALAERLKQTPCPHCKVVGTLIRHGFLYGFDDSSPQRKTPRARRVFCSNRQARPGCGRTFSIWLADKIRRLSLTTGGLWRFLQRAAGDGILAAIRASDGHLSDRTWQRIWKRFDQGQSKIRTALSGRCPPPTLPAEHRPAAHVLAHLQAAFPDNPCPIAAFLRELDRAGLPHNTFTRPAIDLIVRSADGVLRQARNLCVGCLIEAVRSASKTIDIDNVNRVLLQPHWRKESDLVDF